ncbi:chondroitin sulfate synthase 1 [Trichuris trichiura]|uniref:Hexosyltransferase n=1 Tax=Trichuris trichiura TaxID=36087 RepID=A0A077Z8Q9_TRITR|nr:chondroitin sulfate synthase 1 [Trichuris trichiura]
MVFRKYMNDAATERKVVVIGDETLSSCPSAGREGTQLWTIESDRTVVVLRVLARVYRLGVIQVCQDHAMRTQQFDSSWDRTLRLYSRASIRHWALFTVGVLFGYFFTICMHLSPQLLLCTPEANYHTSSVKLWGHHVEPLDRSKSRRLLFVGVMTAQKYLDSRAEAIMKTWGSKLGDSLVFFVGENATCASATLPLVRLKGVDDTYPPQKKSMHMIRYMYMHHGSQFEWFLRADDDVFVRVERLEQLLRSLDASRPLMLGQAGFGKPEEHGKLGLSDGEPYCMGGTGIVLSRETLRLTAPYVHLCLPLVSSNHEDVELNRCVQRFAGVKCTWSYEMQSLFYNNYSGSQAFTGDFNVPEVQHAIVLHPLKEPAVMHAMYRHFKRQEMADLYDRIQLLLHNGEWNLLASHFTGQTFPKSSSLLEPRCSSATAMNVWQFFQSPFAYCSGASECPRHRMKSRQMYAVRNIAYEIIDMMNKYGRQRGRMVEYQSTLYGYWRVEPTVGTDYILDLLLMYKRLKGKRTSMLVRRHVYLRQLFLPLQATDAIDTSHPADADNVNLVTVHVIVPLHKRLTSLQRFVAHFEKHCLRNGEKVSLIVVLFPSDDSESDFQIAQTLHNLEVVYQKQSNISLVVLKKQPFNRAFALSRGAELCPAGSLMFFADVDMLFTRQLLHRIRLNTIKNRQVFFPVVFSEYKPASDGQNHFNHFYMNGHFRYFGFGLVSLYREDFDAVGGMNTKIRGWGLEDVDLFEKCLNNPMISIFRAPEPDLIHVYHDVTCDSNLPPLQLRMCKGRKADGYLSKQRLAEIVGPMLRNGTKDAAL